MALDKPKVSVVMLAYNHERWIEQAVRSVLTQQTDFSLEILIGEDCSTDGTRRLLQRLSDENPGRLTLLLRSQNLGGSKNFFETWSQARGEYIAFLEGDDYWTDPLKLQKQIDALDAHPEWGTCFHRALVVFDGGSRPPFEFPIGFTRPVSTIDDVIADNFIQTCSVVYRNRPEPKPEFMRSSPIGDWPMHVYYAQFGAIGFLPETMAAYRCGRTGSWSSKPLTRKVRDCLLTLDLMEDYVGPGHRKAFQAARKLQVDQLVNQLEQYESVLGSKIMAPVRWAARLAMRMKTKLGSRGNKEVP